MENAKMQILNMSADRTRRRRQTLSFVAYENIESSYKKMYGLMESVNKVVIRQQLLQVSPKFDTVRSTELSV